MPTLKQIEEIIEQGETLKDITSALAEISLLKIKRIKSSVEKNIEFGSEISSVYSLVRTMAALKKISLKKPHGTISFLLTSNERFYGNIHTKLVDYFINQTKNLNSDLAVIGKAGVAFFKANKTPIKPFIFKDDRPSQVQLNELVSLAKDYQRILLFYPQLKTLLLQEPSFIDLSQDLADQNLIQEAKKMFIFEPEIKKMMEFFDTTILSLLFDTVFLEAELSRSSSRLISMDEASHESEKLIKNQ